MQSKHRIISILLILFVVCILSPLSFALTPEQIAQTALGSTVLVTITDTAGQSYFGSGFVIGDGQIATNYHVIEGVASGTVKKVGETIRHPIESVLAIDTAKDLAIIQAGGVTAPALSLGDSDSVQVGQSIYVAGNPQGLTGTFSTGIVSAIRPEGNSLVSGKVLQITAPISPGSSGGPVLNNAGEVVGISVGQVVNGQNLNFAVPVNYLKSLIETTTEVPVYIPDPNLRAAIETAVSKTLGGAITARDMEALTRLSARNSNVTDLTGLEFATNLTYLHLGGKTVGGTWVNNNLITDISALAGLTNLTELYLDNNTITDIVVLAGLTNLTELYLYDNAITDISSLAKLTKLRELWLQRNTITEISALVGLTNLTELYLFENAIIDISPLLENTGLGKGDEVYAGNNPLNNESIYAVITFRDRGVEGLPRPSDMTVSIPDPSLRFAIEKATDKGPGDIITVYDMSWVSNYRLGGLRNDAIGESGISDLTGLEFATRLTELYLFSNTISDISSLAKLTKLRVLNLRGNTITDISPLAGLTHLETLYLNNNRISDISPLVGLTHLQELYLQGNTITDISLLCSLLQQNSRLEIDVEVACDSGDRLRGDVDQNGIVDINDLVLIALSFGQTGYHDADVNVDSVVDITDLLEVASLLGYTLQAPSAHPPHLVGLTSTDVQRWLIEARRLDLTEVTVQKGIIFLEQLALALKPRVTALLPNYPNPFNPETWIPYHLAHPADVTLTIYDTEGAMVRQFDLGYQPAGYYTGKKQAAYWDGRNNLGEPVGSGVYFYQLQAGDFSATRKLVILK